jgi:anti-sigma factor RsiW
MNRYDCETVRDLLPLLVRGEVLPYARSGAEQHLAACDECRAEVALVRVLSASAPATPAGLEARVALALRARTVAAPRWTPGRLAMAATVAAAVLGGSVVFERSGYYKPSSEMIVQNTSFAGDDAAAPLSWAAGQDPLLHGAARLQELSIEELELILAEMDT